MKNDVKFRGIEYFKSDVNIQTRRKADKAAKYYRNRGFRAFVRGSAKSGYVVYRSYEQRKK
ncbi:MAG: hypothetical protein DRP42_03220 [Tenericutes bacterium]|nr:MAG: hypothetical protein DRP42_03220 [Mycoplasmatota bacterium]